MSWNGGEQQSISEKEVLDALQEAIIECDEEKAKAAAQKVLEANVDPAKAIEVAIGGAAETVGKKFDSGGYFLPHLVIAADAMTAASDILSPSSAPVTPLVWCTANPNTYQRSIGSIDFFSGTIIEGKGIIEEAGERLFRLVLDHASGSLTRSETLRYIEPFQVYTMDPVF